MVVSIVDHVVETEEHLVDGGISAWWAGDGRVCMLAEVEAWEARTWAVVGGAGGRP